MSSTTEAEFTAIYVQHRAGSPPIPWGPTTIDEIRRQNDLYDLLSLRAMQAVEQHWPAIKKHLDVTDPHVLARRLSLIPLERLEGQLD